mgnify:CR=1 FL=1
MPQKDFLDEKLELEKQIQKLQRKMRTLHTRQRRPVVNSIIKSMQEYGITPEEITEAFERRQKRGSTVSSTPARYQNPETGDTWTGRGRPPRWIVDAEAQGKSRDSFLIKA